MVFNRVVLGLARFDEVTLGFTEYYYGFEWWSVSINWLLSCIISLMSSSIYNSVPQTTVESVNGPAKRSSRWRRCPGRAGQSGRRRCRRAAPRRAAGAAGSGSAGSRWPAGADGVAGAGVLANRRAAAAGRASRPRSRCTGNTTTATGWPSAGAHPHRPAARCSTDSTLCWKKKFVALVPLKGCLETCLESSTIQKNVTGPLTRYFEKSTSFNFVTITFYYLIRQAWWTREKSNSNRQSKPVLKRGYDEKGRWWFLRWTCGILGLEILP